MKIGLLLIATNKYKQFVKPLLLSANKHFFKSDDVTCYLFTDDPAQFTGIDSRINIVTIQIPSYGFPEATLLRYRMFTDHSDKLTADYLIYSDVDMKIVDHVGTEILPHVGLICTQHPGFYSQGGTYYAGGFQGGSREAYLAAASTMAEWIDDDECNGTRKEWHDETNWNLYLKLHPAEKVLSPSYCMVDQPKLQYAWGIAKFRAIIYAITKDHKAVRS
jgi:hypothetical protein